MTTATKSEAITLDLDGQSIEVATGYKGVGVFLTVIGARGNRIVTVPLPRARATDLAKLLRLAADASRFNDARMPNCEADQRCYRNDGHEGEHAYPE